MFFKSFVQEAHGVFNLSMPIVVLAYFFPVIVSSQGAILLCCLIMGLYIGYLNYRVTKTQEAALKYVPSGIYKETLEQWISQCGVSLDAINLRYGYSGESIAIALFNTICLDPLIFTEFEHDGDAVKVKEIFALHIAPTVSELSKERMRVIRELCMPTVQRFIFMHELGHVVCRYTYKKLLVIALVGALAAYVGIMTAMLLLASVGWWAVLAGMIAGGTVDLVLSYVSNFIFKLREEKKADDFAVRYSVRQEIAAAADFFEKHQILLDTHKDRDSILKYLPSAIATGHPDGRARAQYLRFMAEQASE